MTQPSLFDPIAATTAKRDAINTVRSNASPAWRIDALQAVRWCCERNAEITTDDVWRRLADLLLAAPHEPRALGAIMTDAARLGICYKTDRVRPSERPQCHGRPIAIWESVAKR